jgi:hypothetical protein
MIDMASSWLFGVYYGGANGMFASIPAPMIASTGEHFTSPQVVTCRDTQLDSPEQPTWLQVSPKK